MTDLHARTADGSDRATASRPVLTLAEARADGMIRTKKHASDCVTLAVVTSPALSAALIDRAIELSRTVERGPAPKVAGSSQAA